MLRRGDTAGASRKKRRPPTRVQRRFTARPGAARPFHRARRDDGQNEYSLHLGQAGEREQRAGSDWSIQRGCRDRPERRQRHQRIEVPEHGPARIIAGFAQYAAVAQRPRGSAP